MLSRPGRGRGGGGHHHYHHGGASGGSDTIQVVVSNVKYPVTDETLRRVFAGIAQPLRVTVNPQPTGDVMCVVQFSKPDEAERAMTERNGRFIYSDCNKMTISFAAPQQPQWGNDYGAPSAVLTPPMQHSYGQQQMGYQQSPQQPQGGYDNFMAPQMQHMQQGFNPMMMQMGGGGMGNMGGFNPMMMGGMGGMGAPSVGGRGGGMGGRGGRGGAGGVSVGMPGMMMPGMMMPGMMGQQTNQQQNNLPTVFLSVAQLAEDVPLQHLFTLMEAFGGVVAIRRNHNRPTIATVKMASIAEADLVIQYMRHVPLGASNTVSAKRFPTYTERNACTEEGNPLQAATLQYDFTTSRHRSPQQRSKSIPSKMLKITNCAAATEAELMQFFAEKSFFPERVTRDGDAFTVRMDSIANAVKLLIECQGNVCNEQKSNVIFIEDPQAAAEAAAAGAAGEGEASAQAE